MGIGSLFQILYFCGEINGTQFIIYASVEGRHTRPHTGSSGQQFGQKGYSKTSMREIAGAVGVGVGNIYNYFTNKDELFQGGGPSGFAGLGSHVAGTLLSCLSSAVRKDTVLQILLP